MATIKAKCPCGAEFETEGSAIHCGFEMSKFLKAHKGCGKNNNAILTKGEIAFQKKYHHRSLCNCIREWRGKIIVTNRKCTCGGWEKIKDNQLFEKDGT